jgi:hypothetical protein
MDRRDLNADSQETAHPGRDGAGAGAERLVVEGFAITRMPAAPCSPYGSSAGDIVTEINDAHRQPGHAHQPLAPAAERDRVRDGAAREASPDAQPQLA